MAANIEQVKLAGVTVDIDALAADGFASISDDDRYRLKTQGVCAQRQTGVFMLRIRVPGGRASAEQLRAVADLSQRFGHPSIHVTSRAGLEIHDVAIEHVTTVFEALAAVGLTTKGTCGDTIRNVISCAHGDERDRGPLALEAFERLLHARTVARSDATNISRKMNVALACSPACDAHVATSDIGFVVTPHPASGLPGFTLWGAGGLGATPRLAIRLVDWLPPEDVLAAFEAVVAIGEKYGDRSGRAKAKIKMIVDRSGADHVRALVAEEFSRARERIAAGEPDAIDIDPNAREPVYARTTSGRETVEALIPMGELALDSARLLADAAERYGDGIVYLTTDQNAELHGVAAGDVVRARDAIDAAGLRVHGRGGIADVLSCVGLEYCPLAVAGSMTMGEEIALAMMSRRDDPRYADFRVHVSGCPHSCAKHQVADLGLAGAIVEYEGERVEAFVAYVGGNAHERRLGSAFAKKIPRTLVVPALDAMLSVFERARAEDERFSETVARLGTGAFFDAIDDVLALGARAPDVTGGRLVVIGNGMAGARFSEELARRDAGRFDVTVFGDERGGSYNRIMLSGVLGNHRAAADIVTHPEAWYGERNVTLRSDTAVVRIDRERRVVVASDGSETPYDALVLATGSAPLVPPVPGIAGRDVYVFRTLDDCALIRSVATTGSRAVVLGGGLLGLEAASGLRALGADVSVVHLMPTLMERQLDADAGAALRQKIEKLGIAVHTNARSERVVRDERTGTLAGLELADGTFLPADFIVVCCGIVPRTDLARDAGLTVTRGVVVDDGLRTSDDRIYAVGEVLAHRGTTYGLVEPIWEQCRVLADRLTGTRSRYAGTDVGTRLKVAGVNVVALGARERSPGDEAVVAVGADGSYRKALARDGRLIGAQVVGDPVAAAAFARAFASRAPLPASLAALVFGVDAAGPQPAAVATANGNAANGDSQRICQCNDVSKATILAAIADGARDIAAIGERTSAGTGCGTCQTDLALFLRASAKTG